MNWYWIICAIRGHRWGQPRVSKTGWTVEHTCLRCDFSLREMNHGL